jgi:lipopolysaccharide export system permease protein
VNVFPVLPRYFAKEVLAHAFGVLAVVLAIFVVRRFGSLLGEVAQGPIALSTIGQMLGLRTAMALPSLLPAVLYASVLLALGRLHRDREMTALAACGVAPSRTWRSVVAVALLGAAVIAALSFSVRPWAARRFREVKREATAGADLGSLTPGRFYEIDSTGNLVVFAESRSASQRDAAEGVFVQDRSNGRLSVLFSRRAVEVRDERRGYRFLQLFDGHRYDLDPDGGDLEITSYEELVLRSELKGALGSEPEMKYGSPLGLLDSTDRLVVAELQWQLAMPVSALLLALLAVPLSRTDPRQGRGARLFLAIFLYLVYRQLLGAAKEWVGSGAVSPYPGVWTVHGACVIVIAVLVWADARGEWPALARVRRWRGAVLAAVAGQRGVSGP